MRDLSGLVIAIGAVLVVGGIAARFGLLDWLGRLPGDLRFGSGSTRVFIPLGTSIVLSIVLSVLLALFRR